MANPLPATGTKAWCRKIKQALKHPGFKITLSPDINKKTKHHDHVTESEIRRAKAAKKCLRDNVTPLGTNVK